MKFRLLDKNGKWSEWTDDLNFIKKDYAYKAIHIEETINEEEFKKQFPDIKIENSF